MTTVDEIRRYAEMKAADSAGPDAYLAGQQDAYLDIARMAGAMPVPADDPIAWPEVGF